MRRGSDPKADRTTDDAGDPLATRILDLRGLLCPIPVMRTAEAAAAANHGDLLLLECTDPGVREDIPIWARMHGHRVESMDDQDRLISIHLRIGNEVAAN